MKTELIFDLETTGLLRKGSQIHCIVSRDLSDPDTAMVYDYQPDRAVLKGVHQIMDADVLIGHNILNFDIPLLKERYPDLDPKGEKIDTLVLSRLYYPHIRDRNQKVCRSSCMDHTVWKRGAIAFAVSRVTMASRQMLGINTPQKCWSTASRTLWLHTFFIHISLTG